MALAWYLTWVCFLLHTQGHHAGIGWEPINSWRTCLMTHSTGHPLLSSSSRALRGVFDWRFHLFSSCQGRLGERGAGVRGMNYLEWENLVIWKQEQFQNQTSPELACLTSFTSATWVPVVPGWAQEYAVTSGQDKQDMLLWTVVYNISPARIPVTILP